jgi:hypothetical protein
VHPPLKYYLRCALALPPYIVAKKAVRLAVELVRQRIAASRERNIATYFHAEEGRALARRIVLTAAEVPEDLKAGLPRIAERYLAHEFDLLGSGWTEVAYGADCPGLEHHKYPAGPRMTTDAEGRWLSAIVNRANQKHAAQAWRLISRPDYSPIDWCLDFRSGHRWSVHERFNEQRIGFPPGSDIKLPWELARMQHLPQLAVAAVLAKSEPEGWREPQDYIAELRNQIIDFYCANPPRFGPNWTCPMDVGIRAANWVVAVDIAGNVGWRPDEPFRRLLVDSLYDHGHHILNHLEWSEGGRSNHYLSDIAGQLFIAAYLPPTAETDAWLAFATSELVGETERQFHRDGGNYEGSTSYHRLSGEISVFGAALIVGLAREGRAAFSTFDRAHLAGIRPPVPSAPLAQFDVGVRCPLTETAVDRLAGIGRFADAVLRPDHRTVQIGDTDSGRFLKLHPVWDENDEEDVLDHRHLVAAVDALFNAAPRRERWFDAAVIRSLMGGANVRAPPSSVAQADGSPTALRAATERIMALPRPARREIQVELASAPHDRTVLHFPDFGLVIVKGNGFFLALRCAQSYRADAPSGHLHDDNLSLELYADGGLLVCDPGVYVYTSLPESRNAYRDALAHYAPRAKEWNVTSIDPGLLFQCPSALPARLLYAGVEGVAAELPGPKGAVLVRTIEIGAHGLTIRDGVEGGTLRPLTSPPAYCRGYGKQTSVVAAPQLFPGLPQMALAQSIATTRPHR